MTPPQRGRNIKTTQASRSTWVGAFLRSLCVGGLDFASHNLGLVWFHFLFPFVFGTGFWNGKDVLQHLTLAPPLLLMWVVKPSNHSVALQSCIVQCHSFLYWGKSRSFLPCLHAILPTGRLLSILHSIVYFDICCTLPHGLHLFLKGSLLLYAFFCG